MSSTGGSAISGWRLASVLAISTAVAVAIGATIYYSSLSPSTDVPSVQSKKKKSKSKSKAAKKPIESDASKPHETQDPAPVVATENISQADSISNILSLDVASLSDTAKSEHAQEAKRLGNKLYGEKKFEQAAKLYTKAIELAPAAVFFSNRAACYANMDQFDKVIQDCDQALALDHKYLKAINRRAVAQEKLGKLAESLNDYTAVCVLEGFRNEASMAAPDRVLKVIATEKTQEIMKTKVPVMPSETFISAYMDSFRAQPSDVSILKELVSDKKGDVLLKAAFEKVEQKDWKSALDLVNQAIEANEFVSEHIQAKAYNLRSTFEFLIGRVENSIADLEKSLEMDPENINSIIKRATLFMERGQIEKTMEQFDRAETLAPNNPDVFYHRGQVKFLTTDFQGAIDDYTKSLEKETPEESSVYVHIQMGVAKYKMNDIGGAERKFKEAKRLFPESAEVYNYHGEILMDRQAFSEAQKNFDKAIEMNPKSPLPYINKAVLFMHWKKDIDSAMVECRNALKADPLCDIAYTQLAQLLCHKNEIPEALELYEKAIEVTRTEAEILNVLSCREAAAAQLYVVQNYPEAMVQLGR